MQRYNIQVRHHTCLVQTVYVALFTCMFDVIFVTYKSNDAGIHTQGAHHPGTLTYLSCSVHMLSCLFFLQMCGLGLRAFSGLVCDLLKRDGRGLPSDCTLPEEYLGHNLDEHYLELENVVPGLT